MPRCCLILPALLLTIACSGGRDRTRGDGQGAAGALTGAGKGDLAADHAAAPTRFRRLDAALLDELVAVEVAGFEVAHRDRTQSSLVVALRAETAPVRALVTIGPCLQCRPMLLVEWLEAEPGLRALMPAEVEDDPATRFEIALTEVDGWKCISTWELGAVAFEEELEAAHAARLYCNDGTSEVVVRVDDDSVSAAADPDAVRAAAKRETVDQAMRDLAAAFLGPL